MRRAAVAIMLWGVLSGGCEGGMDGGGSWGLGLDWDWQVGVQSLWEGGNLSYVVSNQRSSTVQISVRDLEERPLTDWWLIPAKSTRVFDGAVLLEHDEVIRFKIEGEYWGMLHPPPPPAFPARLPVVCNEGMLGSGAFGGVQIETDFSVASGSMFHAEVVIPVPGQLFVPIRSEPVDAMEFLEVVAVRSASATVEASSSGFLVRLPDGTSFQRPARVELELALPVGFSGGPLVVLNAGTLHGEGVGGGLVRAVPLAP